MPADCPRCERGVKMDWDYCSWCYGAGFVSETNRFLFRQAIYGQMCQPTLPKTDDVRSCATVHGVALKLESRGVLR